MTAADRALLFAAFSAALAFGTLIPLLPAYLAAGGGAAWHAGAVPVVFLACASLAAPLWGRLSDRVPRAGQAAGSAVGTAAFLTLGTAAFPAFGALVIALGAMLSRGVPRERAS